MKRLSEAADILDGRLQQSLLLARAAPRDQLVLADAVLLAAMDGTAALTAAERTALAASPLTLRRLRHLSQQRRAAKLSTDTGTETQAWRGSRGLLRAAEGSAPLQQLVTDDGCWTLHFLEHGAGWTMILTLAADAPFAAQLMHDGPTLRVTDGAGAVLLQGRLDADGECEQAWPCMDAPAPHFQRHGAVFAVAALA